MRIASKQRAEPRPHSENNREGKCEMSQRKRTTLPVKITALFLASISLVYFSENHGVRAGRDICREKYADQQSSIRLRVSASKQVYRVGEPVEISVLLENISPDRGYLVGRVIYGGDLPTPLHYVNFALSDNRGKPLRVFDGASVQDPIERYGPDGKLISEKQATMAELTAKEYIQLGPGSVYGFRTRLYKPGTTPGHYRLSASYHEVEALERTAAELRILLIPIWTEPLISNTVDITVTR
jgi:hypothetical protein